MLLAGTTPSAPLPVPAKPLSAACRASRSPLRFGDSRLGESVLAVWQAVNATTTPPYASAKSVAAAIKAMS
jgi:hypothetical protein